MATGAELIRKIKEQIREVDPKEVHEALSTNGNGSRPAPVVVDVREQHEYEESHLPGAGGLGSPTALFLAAAGVGTLGIVDDDVVDVSNLQRQVIHNEDTLGEPKVDSAEAAIRKLNPDVKVEKYGVRLDASNIM